MSNTWFVSALDRFNPGLNQPLISSTFTRDIRLDTGIALGHESTSFLRNKWFGQGSKDINANPWLGKNVNSISSVDSDGERVIVPVRDLGKRVTMTKMEMARDELTRMNTLQSKMDALREYFQFITDRYVYTGATDAGTPIYGLVNRTDVSVGNVANGASGFPQFSTKNPDEVIFDFGDMVSDFNEQTGCTLYPTNILVPCSIYNYIAQTPRGNTDTSILSWLRANIATQGGGVQIFGVKWLEDAGVGGTKRMMAYINQPRYVKFPMLPVQPLGDMQTDTAMIRTFVCKFGELELVYPETIIYRDGI